jgi:GTP-binding protein
MSDDIEFYSYTRATRSIKRADIVLFLIDATLKISQVDKKLAHFITDEHKACIFVINKWDLAKERADADDYGDYLTEMLPGLRYAPIAFTTASEGKNIQTVLDLTTEIYKQANTKVSTGRLNRAIEVISQQKVSGSKKRAGFPKIYYGTQVATSPISILLFVNRPELFDDSFIRFATNQFRDILDIQEVPIRLMLRRRSQDRHQT